MSTPNLTLLTDLYELTMMQGYFKAGNNSMSVFDAFYRSNPSKGGYAIFAGLEQVIEYMDQKEVAQKLGISQSYISRLEKRIMLRLRKEILRQTSCA